MKSRIIESLHRLSQENSTSKATALLSILSKETGFSAEEIQVKSKQILKSIINNYASFEVSTIDGFTHRVLRTFAKDLELPLNFEVELHTEEVLTEAVDRLINKAGTDDKLTKVLVSFVLGKTDEDKSWDISRDLLSIAKLLTEETSRPYLEMLKNKSLEDFQQLADLLRSEKTKAEKESIIIAQEFFQLLESNAIEGSDFSRGSCPNFFRKILNKELDQKFDAKWQLEIESHPLYPKAVHPHKQEILDNLQPQIARLFREVKTRILRMQLLNAIEKNLVPLSLLSAIQNEVEELKKENSVVLISDFNATIGSAVKDQPAPFIYERLGERYRHYFIDEFQDTSQLQWENLIPLVDHTLSGGNYSEETGSLTLVGDAKQSIYRWRGGKAEQFMELCAEKNPFNIEQKQVVVLPKNYRSARSIVNFNNSFFNFSASVFENSNHRNLFEKSAQEPVSTLEGYVNISFVEAENAEEELQVYPQRVLEIIQELELQGIPKKSICILTRKRKESVAVANFLSENDISVISAESLLLSRSPEVLFINSILACSLDSSDQHLKFEILDFLLSNQLRVENDFQFRKDRLPLQGQVFFDSLKSFEIDFNVDHLNSLSVYEGVEYIIRSFGLIKGSNAYLQFYLDFVYETSHSKGYGIFDFLELWERKKDSLSIIVPEGEDAVQIMTIHKAKGLEFPVVIYPFANSPIKDTAREHFWMNLPEHLQSSIRVAYLQASEKMKDWEGEAPSLYEELIFNSQLDALNVLYVALTRPVQRLYVISKMDLDRKGNENLNKFSGLFISYLKDLGKWDGSTQYEIGNVQEALEIEISEGSSVTQEAFYSSPTEANGISILTRSGMLWDSKQEMALEKGQLVHELFARIHSEKDVQKVLFEAREEGLIKDEEERDIERLIKEVVSHPQLMEYFIEGVLNYNERDIISGHGEVMRPDRLNFHDEKVSIIDYKTGAEDRKHLEQVNTYAQILQEMGYVIDKKILIYLNEPPLIKNV